MARIQIHRVQVPRTTVTVREAARMIIFWKTGRITKAAQVSSTARAGINTWANTL